MSTDEVLGPTQMSVVKEFLSPVKESQFSNNSEKLLKFCYSPKYDVFTPHVAGHSQSAIVLPLNLSSNLGSLGSYFKIASKTNMFPDSQKKLSEGSPSKQYIKTKDKSRMSRLGVLERKIMKSRRTKKAIQRTRVHR